MLILTDVHTVYKFSQNVSCQEQIWQILKHILVSAVNTSTQLTNYNNMESIFNIAWFATQVFNKY